MGAKASGGRGQRTATIETAVREAPRQTQETQAARRAGMPQWLRFAIAYLLLALVLIVIERSSFALASVPIRLTIGPNAGILELDGSTLLIPWASTNVQTAQATPSPTGIIFMRGSALTREFQIDGTDSTNNFTEDIDYLSRIANSPYYRFQAAMRGNESYSAWRDISAHNLITGLELPFISVADGAHLALPSQAPIAITAALGRPETSAQILLLCADIPCAEALIDRNDRFAVFHTLLADGSVGEERKAYFPNQPLPFFAEVMNTLARIALWSLALVGLLAAIQVASVLLAGSAWKALRIRASSGRPHSTSDSPWHRPSTLVEWAHHRYSSLTSALRTRLPITHARRMDIAAGLIVLASFAFTLYVALVQYRGYPHILDASAYYFQAKIFASGRLSAPVPGNLDAFQGPFMIAYQGRWFAQYAPATSLLLALGMVLRVPWLIEPLLGAAAIWGIYRIGCLLFSPFEGMLAVLLAALSPFYAFLVPSYLSHIPALFFAVYFLLTLLRFGRYWRSRDLLLAAACLGALLLTRELSAVIIGAVSILYVAFVHHAALRRHIAEWLPALPVASAIFCLAVFGYLLYSWLQTGDALTTPRMLFSPADVYGFGEGIGFYGQHTLAAGLVNLDQLLTILLIDLYGWPFYLTLAFVPCAFLRLIGTRHIGRASFSSMQWDTFCLLLLCALIAAQVGYFYHGIFLGPRYLYETLPFLLLLTARGITALGTTLAGRMSILALRSPVNLPDGYALVPLSSRLGSGLVGVTLLALLACNLLYFMPRQLELHTDFTGLPSYRPIDTRTVYGFHPASSVIVTTDRGIYNYLLWPLNDPDLSAPTIYAYAANPDELAHVRAIYPARTFYTMSIAPDGHVSFSQITG